MNLRVGIDTGGTFTDVVVAEGNRVRAAAKSTTTHGELANGLLRALDKTTTEGQRIDEIVHGTTVALNAILTRRGADVGFVTTTGFRDLLDMARGWRPAESLIDARWRRPHELRPIVERARRRTVHERVTATGETLIELNEQDLLDQVRRLVADGCRSIAIGFLHSYKHPRHEQRAVELVRQHFPDVSVSSSAEIAPFPREYNRFSTCALNAYVQPEMAGYTTTVEESLRATGRDAPLTFMTNDGGLSSPAEVTTRPVTTLNSGPVGGLMGVQAYAQRLQMPHLVGFDMGGTSTDVGLVVDNRLSVNRELELEHDLIVSLPVLELHSIGAGGGSIATIDEAGGLSVGPHSAGSNPGPACYGRGGTQPTVTDAFLLLGMLDPTAAIGGEIEPDLAAAEGVFATLATAIDASPTELAGTVVDIAVHNMAEAVRRLTIYRGVDPREFGLLAYGAAGGLVATQVARTLEIPQVVIPALSGVFSAYGLLSAVAFEEDVTPIMSIVTEELARDIFARAKARAHRLSDQLRNRTNGEIHIECHVDATYLGQRWELAALVDPGHDDPMKHLADAFGAAHQRQYGYRLPAPIYVQTLRVRAIASDNRELLPPPLPSSNDGDSHIQHRDVTIAGKRHVDTPIYQADKLTPGQVLTGPGIIAAPTSTTTLVPGDVASVTEVGDIVIDTRGQA